MPNGTTFYVATIDNGINANILPDVQYKIIWGDNMYYIKGTRDMDRVSLGEVDENHFFVFTNYPFFIVFYNSDSDDYKRIDLIVANKLNLPTSFSIEGYQTIVRIDEKFLDTDDIKNTVQNLNDLYNKVSIRTYNIISGDASGSIRTRGSIAESSDYKIGENAFAEGASTKASGEASHAEGYITTASGKYSHSEGNQSTASGDHSHAEGKETVAAGYGSHAEGIQTEAQNTASHAEGNGTVAIGGYMGAHAEGYYTEARGAASHTEGMGTVAIGQYQHVQGVCNVIDVLTAGDSETVSPSTYLHIVGNGNSNTNRSNAHTVDKNGNGWFAGTIEGTALILKSSTPNSTKRFRITVDDSGTISATAIN